MGREARVRELAGVKRRIVLSEADCDKWLAQYRLLELEKRNAREKAARLALEMVAKEIAAREEETRALFTKLGKKYGFNPTDTYDIDPARRTLTRVETPAPPEGGPA